MRIEVLSRAGAILVAAALLAGCASTVVGTARPAATGRVVAGASPGTTAPSTPPGPDAAQLHATLLQAGDLPTGWTSDEDGATDSGDMPELATCLGGGWTAGDQVVTDGAPEFADSSGDAIFSHVAGFLSQRHVDGDAMLLTSPRASDCLKTSIAEIMDPPPEGATVSDVRATLTPGSAGGPSNVVATGSGTVSLVREVDGRRGALYLEYVFITGRLTEAELVFMSVRAPLPDSLVAAAVAAVAQRVAAL